MNICILKESLDIGGTERSAANISKVLSPENEVYIALYDASQIKYSYAGQIVDFQLPPRSSLIGKIFNTYCRDIKLRRLIKDKQIDVLYTFTGIGNRQTRYKYNAAKIISARDFGGLHEKHREYNTALENSDAMICNSEYTKNYYLSKYPEDSGKVFAVYNYIDIDEITREAQEPSEEKYDDFLSKHKNTVVSAGRFCKEKGFEYLIEAVVKARQENDDIGLVLVGDGDYKKKYEDIIKHFGVEEHVYFTGFQKNPYKYMKKCNVFVLSSLSEGFPNVLAEAMALGLPVISDNCYSGPAEILRADKDYYAVKDIFIECDYGILTPRITETDNEDAISQLAKAITELLNDECKMTCYSAKSLERARDFSKEATGKQLNNIFDKLMARRPKK